jgi:hypothetical protein
MEGSLFWSGCLPSRSRSTETFAGYTDIARGSAKLFGVDLMENFKVPYAATGFSDFWRRWHVSLSTWLRDYLYFPLGGSQGSKLATLRNLMVTMVLGGLWHGAGWGFVIWGALHGSYLIIERVAGWRIGRRPQLPVWLVFVAVSLTWVPFRATSFPLAMDILTGLFDPLGGAQLTFAPITVAVMGLATMFVDVATRRDLVDPFAKVPAFARGLGYGTAIVLAAMFWPVGRSSVHLLPILMGSVMKRLAVIGLGVLVVLAGAELGLRAAPSLIPDSWYWPTPEAQLKYGHLMEEGRDPSVVLLGSSFLEAAFDPDLDDSDLEIYNLAMPFSSITTMQVWLDEVVSRSTDPRDRDRDPGVERGDSNRHLGALAEAIRRTEDNGANEMQLWNLRGALGMLDRSLARERLTRTRFGLSRVIRPAIGTSGRSVTMETTGTGFDGIHR